MTSSWVRVVEPSPVLRAVHHQVRNLLAPVTVAAELLDDGSETASMLRRASDRIRFASDAAGTFLRMEPPVVEPIAVSVLADRLGVPAEGSSVGDRFVAVDLNRIVAALGTLVDALDGRPAKVCVSALAWPPGQSDERLDGDPACPLVETVKVSFRSRLVRIPACDVERLAFPLAVESAPPVVAPVCRDVHLHGGRVRVTGDLWEVFLPLLCQGTSR